jgi:hypothetical protein
MKTAPHPRRMWALALFANVAAVAAIMCAAARAAEPELAFRLDEGQNLNAFVRQGPVAAHLLLRSGQQPRILVAFPAGNSGVGLWFARTDTTVNWRLISPPRPVNLQDPRGRALHGIEFEAETDAAELRFEGAVLSSIRVLRDFELLRKSPPEVAVAPRVGGDGIRWARDRLDGAPGYQLSVDAAGSLVSAQRIARGAQPIRLRVRALTGEAPLRALANPLTSAAGIDPRARNALAFLSYQEKFLAGSWRFDTYFGRDTLISALLLAPVLEPPAIESAISSVLDRLAPNGEVAHEEDIGEFAVLRHAREGRGKTSTPVYDYGMVDDDFLLAPLVAHWLLDDVRARDRAATFLGGLGANGQRRGESLVLNLTWLVGRTAGFAQRPQADRLVGIKSGRMTGNWRDSEQGLGRGRYPYDVNAALVPAALEAAARLQESGLLTRFANDSQRQQLATARASAKIWAAKTPGLFAVEIPPDRARERVAAYARDIGVDAAPALEALGQASLSFHALALDEAGKPIPILNSDEGFRWLLTEPAAEELSRGLASLMRPFPAGLLTDAGLLVANPAQATPELQREFTRFAYHGTVVWSWQQALMAAALERQLRRRDLPAAVRAQITRARQDLWAVIRNTKTLRTSELWSWSFADGRFQAEPFGRADSNGADADESNAAQLWSTVFLGLSEPRTDTSPEN